MAQIPTHLNDCADQACMGCTPPGTAIPWTRVPPATQALLAAAQAISDECDALKEFLLAKNAAYGNSAFQPINVMSRLSPLEGIKLRIDDKLKRMQMGDGTATEDTVKDLAGYYILHGAAKRLGL